MHGTYLSQSRHNVNIIIIITVTIFKHHVLSIAEIAIMFQAITRARHRPRAPHALILLTLTSTSKVSHSPRVVEEQREAREGTHFAQRRVAREWRDPACTPLVGHRNPRFRHNLVSCLY